MRGSGRVAFAGTLLLIVGILNIFYGIGALGDANVLVGDKRLVFSNLHTYGWVLLILGLIQLTGGISLLGGNTYGRVIGIVAASLGAIESLVSIGGRYPWWELGVFALCVYVLHGLIMFGQDSRSSTA
jgi:signal transduction histidine kinase